MNAEIHIAGSTGWTVNGLTAVNKTLSGIQTYNTAYKLSTGEKMTFTFEGTNIGILKAREASATGAYDCNIDNGAVTASLSPTGRAPAKMATGLKGGTHTVTITNNSNMDAHFYAIFTWE